MVLMNCRQWSQVTSGMAEIFSTSELQEAFVQESVNLMMVTQEDHMMATYHFLPSHTDTSDSLTVCLHQPDMLVYKVPSSC